MIADSIKNLNLYSSFVPAAEILAFVEKVEKEHLAPGRYDLDGDNLFALVQEYVSKPKAEARMESHDLYTDLQYVISGEECIGWEPVENLTVEEDRTPDADVIFYETIEPMGANVLKAGMFGIYLPTDGHMPGVAVNECVPVHKIVFKIRKTV
jgi:YhcH/YjgK/YiaL family protein